VRFVILVFLFQFFPVRQLPFHLAFILGKMPAFCFSAQFQDTLNTVGFFSIFFPKKSHQRS